MSTHVASPDNPKPYGPALTGGAFLLPIAYARGGALQARGRGKARGTGTGRGDARGVNATGRDNAGLQSGGAAIPRRNATI